MPLFSSRPQPSGVDGLLQIISMGECDDHTIRQLHELVTHMGDDDVKSLADVLMTNLVKYPDDIAVLTGSVKALEIMPFMPKARNEFIITLLLSLLKSPVNKKDALQRKTLKTEIIKFMLFFVSKDDQYAKLMMPELIAALDDAHGSISSSVFHTLQRLAVEKPEYFERYSTSLIKELGSINKMTRAESAKIIGILAKTHPEYVCKAMPFLQSLASFYPDSNVKRNANEAYQIIWKSVKKEPPQAPVVARKAVTSSGKGFADIVKLNSGTPNGNSEAQFTDEELKEIIELTRTEFKSDAEAILDSLGVGHLNVKGKQGRARSKPTEPAPAQKMKKPAVPSKADKNDPDYSPMPRSGIANAIKREPKELVTSLGMAQLPKCPRCGGSTWAAGQLCDTCAGAEFDRKAARGQYDTG
jgi:hypothetical protein